MMEPSVAGGDVQRRDVSWWSDAPRLLGGGAHARVWELPGPGGPRALKVGDPAMLAREAGVLAELAGRRVAPTLVAAADGLIVAERLSGEPRSAAEWGTRGARALGALVARVHATRASTAREVPEDGWRQGTAQAYQRARASAVAAAAPPGLRSLVERVLAAAPDPDPGPAVRVHGDLWSGNVIWCNDGPRLIDWEYSHQGEAAEDLAGLAAMDGLSAPLLAAVLDGYGADDPLRDRVARWRPLMGVWCGLWYSARADEERAAVLFGDAERCLGRPAG